ncbi:hypothetical protein [Candidatus Soleaferrea massiliensis]|uniref:hypothetical protein n=1 Tax=Candidatus Soleaferrea massiliensis TaxID=1470354 RepID=UPI00058DF356|nr:hypothetical protein [Candidatus Soleaferrea massiliensis]
MSTIALKRTAIRNKSIMTVLTVVAAIVLPQVFHAVGMVSGTGAMLGSAFLPMHLPVLLAGLMGGPAVGVIAGALSPVISAGISGMPAAAVLPFMVIELAGYGLVGGFLAKTKLPVFAKLVLTQAAGRALRAAAVLIAVYGLGSQAVQAVQIWNMVTTGLPGILLQWALIPLLIYRIEGMKKRHD